MHFWPFDGWSPPLGRSVIAEVYPILWSRTFPKEDRNAHQHDAYSVARWMQEADAAGELTKHFQLQLRPRDRLVAQLEGWILGLT